MGPTRKKRPLSPDRLIGCTRGTGATAKHELISTAQQEILKKSKDFQRAMLRYEREMHEYLVEKGRVGINIHYYNKGLGNGNAARKTFKNSIPTFSPLYSPKSILAEVVDLYEEEIATPSDSSEELEVGRNYTDIVFNSFSDIIDEEEEKIIGSALVGSKGRSVGFSPDSHGDKQDPYRVTESNAIGRHPTERKRPATLTNKAVRASRYAGGRLSIKPIEKHDHGDPDDLAGGEEDDTTRAGYVPPRLGTSMTAGDHGAAGWSSGDYDRLESAVAGAAHKILKLHRAGKLHAVVHGTGDETLAADDRATLSQVRISLIH